MFDRPAQMEPMLPTQLRAQLEASALELVRESGALGAALREPMRAEVVGVLRSINSYYSNLIEGHGTRPIDIERALRGDYSRDPKRKQLQLESRAHVEVQRELDRRLDAEPDLDLASERRGLSRYRATGTNGSTHACSPHRTRLAQIRFGERPGPTRISHARHSLLFPAALSRCARGRDAPGEVGSCEVSARPRL